MSAQVEELKAQLEADERLQPGQEGWWKVWGARPYNITKGDIVVTIDDQDPQRPLRYDYVAEMVEGDVIRVRWYNEDGKMRGLGALFTGFALFRKGTHNMLAS